MESSSSEFSQVVRALPGTAAFAAAALTPASPPPDVPEASPSRGPSALARSAALLSPVSLVTADRAPGPAESGALVRGRLCAATAVMFVATFVFYLRGFFLEFAPVRVLHLIVVLGLGACVILLRGPWRLSTSRVRLLELAIFGGVSVYLALYQYSLLSHRMLDHLKGEAQVQSSRAATEAAIQRQRAHLVGEYGRLVGRVEMANTTHALSTSSLSPAGRDRPPESPVNAPRETGPSASAKAPADEDEAPNGELLKVPAILGSTIMYSTTLMLIYGMLIPNTWRRAAAVVVPIALLAIAVPYGLSLQFPALWRLTASRFGFEQMSNDVLMVAIGAGLAIYGTHLIHSLRVEAHEARRMGQYVLRQRLGGGGMGEVYLAEHRLMKRPCALKLIRPERARDARSLARFEREVRAMARLSHWNTVEVYDYGHSEDGTFYYVMEYLRGPSLNELVKRHGPLPAGRVIYLLRQACDALAEAHAAGLVHRDLKPANIIAAESGGRHDVVKLLDFGLVTPLAEEPPPEIETTLDGIVTGSPLYMSPEQATGDRRPDGRSDLYSLGAVGYFLLTGRPPFEGPTALSVMMSHARDSVPPLSKLLPGVPRDLEAIILHCLAKSPADRYADADTLNRALGRCQAAQDWDAHKAALWWKQVQAAGASSSATVAAPL